MSREYLVTVNTLDHNKRINDLLKKGVVINDIVRDKFSLTLRISSVYLDLCKEYFSEKWLEYEVKELTSVSLSKRIKNRLYFFITIVLIIAVLGLSFNCIFFVKITGNEKVDKNEIISVLTNKGIKFPCFKKGIDTKIIKNAVTEINGVALASVAIKGVYLYIDVNEELDEKSLVEKNYLPLVASENCIITKIVAERGTAMVKEGDTVKKGETLIAPYYCLNDEGKTISCEAIGIVEGRVFHSDETIYAERRIESVKTGESFVTRELIFGDKVLIKGEENPFSDNIEEITVTETDILPLTIVEKRFWELENKEIYEAFSDKKGEIEQDLYSKLYIQCKKSIQIIDKWCIITNNAGCYSVKCIIETLEDVSQKAVDR